LSAAGLSVLAVLAQGPIARAQDDADAPAEPAETTETAEPAQTAEPAEPAPSEEPTPPRAGNDSDDVFVPTEEIAADEEVVFPVDI
jgi:hypothetical protein